MSKSAELALIGGQIHMASVEQLTTTPLWQHLGSSVARMADNRSIAETLANDPGLRRMCEETLPGLERMAAPVGAAGVQEILKIPLTGMYGHPKAGGKDKTAEELTVYWIGLMNGLKDLPKAALEEALMSYVKTAQIPRWPTVGELNALAKDRAIQLRQALMRAKMALQIEPRPVISKEDRAAARAEWAEKGWLRADGSFDAAKMMAYPKGVPPTGAATGETKAQMADRLRQAL